MNYSDEAKIIIGKFSRINRDLLDLETQVTALMLKKKSIELDLAKTREEERALIDRIKKETGKTPNFHELIQGINNENVTMV